MYAPVDRPVQPTVSPTGFTSAPSFGSTVDTGPTYSTDTGPPPNYVAVPTFDITNGGSRGSQTVVKTVYTTSNVSYARGFPPLRGPGVTVPPQKSGALFNKQEKELLQA